MARAVLVLTGLLCVSLSAAGKSFKDRLEAYRHKCYNFYDTNEQNCESYTACLDFVSMLLNGGTKAKPGYDTGERYEGFDKLSIITTLKHTTELFAGREGKAKWMYCDYPPGLTKAYNRGATDKFGKKLVDKKYYYNEGDNLETMMELVWNIKQLLLGQKLLSWGASSPPFSYPNFLHWRRRVEKSIGDYGRLPGKRLHRGTEQKIEGYLDAMEKSLLDKLRTEGDGKAKVTVYTKEDLDAAVKVIEGTQEKPKDEDGSGGKDPSDTTEPTKPEKKQEKGEKQEIEIFKEAAQEVVDDSEKKMPKKPDEKPDDKKPDEKPDDKKPDENPDDKKPEDGEKPGDSTGEETEKKDEKGYLVVDIGDMGNVEEKMTDFSNPESLRRSLSAVELAPDFEDIDEAQLRRSNSVGVLFE